MAAQFGIVLPLWSYAADGGVLLDRAAGEVGLDHVTVPVVTGPQAAFRLYCDAEKPHFHTVGGWHFPPTAKCYALAGVRPARAAWCGAADYLGRLQEHAGRLSLRLVLRVDVRAVPALVEHEPHLCQRNAWGQEVPSAGACACNPVVRELLRATLEDLRRYQPAAYELVEFAPDMAIDRAATRPLAWNAPLRRLADVCFCASCRQTAERAGIDADAAGRSVRVQIERGLGDRPPETNPVVNEYIAARTADTSAWLAAVAASDQDRRYLTRLARFPEGPSAATDGLTLPVWRPAFAEAAALVRTVADAVGSGGRFFDFEGLDEAPPDAVTWLKQAVRFARRG
jgi:hypothetical protein